MMKERTEPFRAESAMVVEGAMEVDCLRLGC